MLHWQHLSLVPCVLALYVMKHTGKEKGCLQYTKDECSRENSWQVWDILASILVSKTDSAAFYRVQIRVHKENWIATLHQKLSWPGKTALGFLNVVLTGIGSGVFLPINLFWRVFTACYPQHHGQWLQGMRELSCLPRFFLFLSTSLCAMDLEGKLSWGSCLVCVVLWLSFLFWKHIFACINFLIFFLFFFF